MVTKEIAALLDGMEYNEELPVEVVSDAKRNGVVIVFGASDDLMEFRGAIEDEADCYKGGFILFDKGGLVKNKCDNEDCPYFREKLLPSKYIEAIWDSEGYSWIYKTGIIHETFEILKEGRKYCRGVVFSMGVL